MKKVALIAALLIPPAWGQGSEQGSVLGASGGRFVFGQISSYRRDQFLLDTQTGRLWQHVCLLPAKDEKGCESFALQPLDFVDTKGAISTTPPAATGK